MNPPLRVVFVLPDLPLSGAATRTALLARDLAEGGDEVVVRVLVDRIAGHLANDLTAAGVDVSTLAAGSRADRRASSPTVVHAAMPTAGLAGLLLATRLGAPLVYSVTNSLHVDRPLRRSTPRDQFKAALEGLAIEHAHAIHAVSPGVASQIVRRHPRARTRLHTVVHPPADPTGARTNDPALPAATPRLLCLGRLLEHKRVEDAIAATALLLRTFPLARLAIVGTGPRSAPLRSLVTVKGLERHVTFVGETADPASYLAWADVLVHPSLYEGYPRVVAEARATGVPAVCAATAHAPRGDGIHHARPLDADALRAAIVRAVQSPSRGPSRTARRVGTAHELRQLYRHLAHQQPAAGER